MRHRQTSRFVDCPNSQQANSFLLQIYKERYYWQNQQDTHRVKHVDNQSQLGFSYIFKQTFIFHNIFVKLIVW